MFIDETFFKNKNLIVNVNEPEPNNRTGIELIEIIDESEEEVLSMAFGREMWEDVKLNSENYESLIKGEKYSKNGKHYYWQGIVDEGQKKSFLVDYVYAKYHTQNVTQQTEFGQVKADMKIGNVASSTPKIVDAWNRFLEVYQGMYGRNIGNAGLTLEGNPYWIVSNRLGNGNGVSYYAGRQQGGDVSLLQYLKDNEAKYPLLDGNFQIFAYKNSFGV